MRLSKMLAVGALVAVSAAPSFAQGQGGRGFGRGGFGAFGGGPMSLLNMAEVQKELKLDAAQVDLIKQLQAEADMKRRQQFQGFQDLSQEERQKRFQELQANAPKARAEEDKKIAEILDAKQVARLKQLEVQQLGARALERPEVQTQLKITADQKTKIAAMIMEQGTALRGLFQDGQRPTAEQMTELRKTNEAKLLGLLTADQKKQFDTMKGAPFTFPEIQRRRRNNDNNA